MKTFHIRLLATLPVFILFAAGLPLFAHLWSHAVSDALAEASFIALMLANAVTAPWHRWMLVDREQSTGAFGFALGIVAPVGFVVTFGAAQASKALGLHSGASGAVGLVVAVSVTVASLVAMSRLLPWTLRRINAAYDAAEQRKARNGGAA